MEASLIIHYCSKVKTYVTINNSEGRLDNCRIGRYDKYKISNNAYGVHIPKETLTKNKLSFNRIVETFEELE